MNHSVVPDRHVSDRSARPIGEARPFLLLLLVTLAALGLVNQGLRDRSDPPVSLLIWGLYGATWILLLL